MQSLEDIEQIRRLKSRYFRCLDTKQWAELRACFAKDFTARIQGPHPDIEFNSADEFIAMNSQMLADVPTVHQGHTSEIDILDGEQARGIWSMYDRVELPDAGFEGWGHYHEEYRKEEGDWKIARLHLTRLLINPLTQ